jgi:RNA ligase
MMDEIRTFSDIQQLAVAGFTDWRRYGEVSVDATGDLLIFNYTHKAQFEARWNFFERVSRGLIINRRTGESVARPFDKFFNWGELGQTTTAAIVSVTEKMDGSLGILFRADGYRIATRGSFTSDQAIWATRFLNENYRLDGLPNAWTLLFEIVYPENRVVVDYGDERALILLAIRNRFSGEYLPFAQVQQVAARYGFKAPRVFDFSDVADILTLRATLDVSQEGWVAEFADGQRFKFKGDRYMELHRLITGLSFKHTLEAVAAGTVEAIRSQIPDEFLGDFNRWLAIIYAVVAETRQRIQAAFAAAPKATRKEFALWVMAQHKPLAPYLFATLDGKNIEPMIYKMAFENFEEEQAVHLSENTA